MHYVLLWIVGRGGPIVVEIEIEIESLSVSLLGIEE